MELHKGKERIIMKKALALILTAVLGIQAGAVSAEELSSGEGLDIVVVEESDDTEAVIEETIILEDDLPDESVQEELIAGDESLLSGDGDDASVQQSDDISGILKLFLGEIPARTGETGQDPDFSRYEELFSLLPKPEAGQPEMDGITPEIVDEVGIYLSPANAYQDLSRYLTSYGTYSDDIVPPAYCIKSTFELEDDWVFHEMMRYEPSTKNIVFTGMVPEADGSFYIFTEMKVPYNRTGPAHIVYKEISDGKTYSSAFTYIYDYAGYKISDSPDLDFIVETSQVSSKADLIDRANDILSSGFVFWEKMLKASTGITFQDLGFGREGTVSPVLTLSKKEIELSPGISEQVIITEKALDDSVSAWQSSNPAVAKVDAKGNITGVSVGTAKVTVTLKSGLSGTVLVTVKSPVQQPRLIAAYNGAKGIGVKFYKVDGVSEYALYRKFNGVWGFVCYFNETDPNVQISNGTLMYTDTSVAGEYGKGYIYSVASKKGLLLSKYDTKGVAIYRLTPPSLKSITNSDNGTATVLWTSVFGKTETNGNYDLQFAEYKDGKTGTFRSLKALPGFANTTSGARVTGLKKGSRYVFRIRCSKTNKDRGTYYSEYSPWLSVTIAK